MMRAKSSTPGERLLEQRMEARLAEEDRKNKATRKRPDGPVFRACKWLCYIGSVYAFMVLLLNGIIFLSMGLSKITLTAQQRAFYSMNLVLVLLLTVVTVASFILLLNHRSRLGGWGMILAGALLIAHIVMILTGLYVNQYLLAGLFCPALLILPGGIGITALLAHHSRRLKKAVAEEWEKIYAEFERQNEGTLATGEDWEAMLLAHEQAAEKPIEK